MSYEGAITPASVKLPSAPTRENYNFQGWTDEANSETSKWSAGTTISVSDKTKTIYAAWKQGYYCSVCKQLYQIKHYSCYNGHHFREEHTGTCRTAYYPSCSGTKWQQVNNTLTYTQQNYGTTSTYACLRGGHSVTAQRWRFKVQLGYHMHNLWKILKWFAD